MAIDSDPPGLARVTASASAKPHPASTAGATAQPRRRATTNPTAPSSTEPPNNTATASGWLNTNSATYASCRALASALMPYKTHEFHTGALKQPENR
ncbi:hypothetical protein GCM10027184_67190 [Saccharothrix stipae]